LSERHIDAEGERRLYEAGWERVDLGGETYFSKPDSGHLYPRGAAYDTYRHEGTEE